MSIHTGFSGPTTSSSFTWNWGLAVSIVIGGAYTFMWGYGAFGSVNSLNTDLAFNYISGTEPPARQRFAPRGANYPGADARASLCVPVIRHAVNRYSGL